MARLIVPIVKYLAGGSGEPVVAIDGAFARWGKHVAEARWPCDGSTQGGRKTSFGKT